MKLFPWKEVFPEGNKLNSVVVPLFTTLHPLSYGAFSKPKRTEQQFVWVILDYLKLCLHFSHPVVIYGCYFVPVLLQESKVCNGSSSVTSDVAVSALFR